MKSPSMLSPKQRKAIIAGAVALSSAFSFLNIDDESNSLRSGYTQQSMRGALSLDSVNRQLMAEDRPIMTTFFEPVEGGCCGMTEQDHQNLVDSWKRAWEGHGWKTRIFTEADARKHPLFELFQNKLIEANVNEFERRGFWRWLAMANDDNALGGWMSDYDLFPLSLTSHKGLYLMSKPGFKTYGGQVPALIHADQASWETIVEKMIKALAPDIDIENISDMRLLDYLHKHYTEGEIGVTTWEFSLSKTFPYKRVPEQEYPVIDCEVAKSHLAAHLSPRAAQEAHEVTHTYPKMKEEMKSGAHVKFRSQAADVMMTDLDQCVNLAETYFRISNQIDHTQSPVYPSQILIEVNNPKPDQTYWYSVTIESGDRYSGRATLLGPSPGLINPALVYTWTAPFSGTFNVIVHELEQNPRMGIQEHNTPTLPVQTVDVRVKNGYQDPWGIAVDRMNMLPPCQIVGRMDVYTNWDGTWIGPEHTAAAKVENTLRNKWMFVPSEEMDCKIETFGENEFNLLTEEKRIYILGNSKERGIFLSLVDLLLDGDEKKGLPQSVISKCWGRAVVSKNNMKVMYQDWRSDNFDTQTDEHTVVCHNEKVARQGGPLFFESGMQVWEEIFLGDRAMWPQVIVMSTGDDFGGYESDSYDINQFVTTLPPDWDGTLFLTDGEFSAKRAGKGDAIYHMKYRARLQELTFMTNDRRVRWLDGIGLSKDMIMYGEYGPGSEIRSQHFNRDCDETYEDANGVVQSMRVCSNVTENIAQLLIGHALGPKADLLASSNEVQTLGDSGQNMQLIICHNCPNDLLPFHITPYPDMTCTVGVPLHARTLDEVSDEPQTCPEKCMNVRPERTFGSQSKVVHVRSCPYEFFPEGFQVGNKAMKK